MPELHGFWQPVPRTFPHSSEQLSLWRFRLNLALNEVNSLVCYLSADEKQRAERLLLPEKRKQFIVARARLRIILGRHSDADPAALIFGYGKQGKPLLPDNAGLDFNLAHSGDWGLVAISGAAEVGVDIERIDPQIDYPSLAKRYFTTRELKRLHSMPHWRQRRGFYRIWTEKEALLKMTGVGFSAGAAEQSTTHGWVRPVPVAKGYLAALSCSKSVNHILRYNFS